MTNMNIRKNIICAWWIVHSSANHLCPFFSDDGSLQYCDKFDKCWLFLWICHMSISFQKSLWQDTRPYFETSVFCLLGDQGDWTGRHCVHGFKTQVSTGFATTCVSSCYYAYSIWNGLQEICMGILCHAFDTKCRGTCCVVFVLWWVMFCYLRTYYISM